MGRVDYLRDMRERIEELGYAIGDMRSRLEEVDRMAERKVVVAGKLAELEFRRREMQRRLDEMERQPDTGWNDLRAEFEQQWDDLVQDFEERVGRLS